MKLKEQSGEISELQFIKGVGPKRAEIFAKEGITKPEQLLQFYPVNYIDRSGVTLISDLHKKLLEPYNIDFNKDISAGFNLSNEYTIVAKIVDKNERHFGRNRGMLALTVQDAKGGTAQVTFWNMVQFFARKYEINMLLMISGKAEIDKFNKLSFNHPEIEIISPEDEKNYADGAILPKYRISDPLAKAGITNRVLRKIIEHILPEQVIKLEETLPQYLIRELKLPNIKEMVKNLHFPESREKLEFARHRLKFEEIFFYMIPIVKNKLNNKLEKPGIYINPKSKSARQLYDDLPFELTSDQKKVLREIAADIKSGRPMNRLLQGDVGSGKTIVAVLTLLMAIDQGFQTAFMAPTEILAEQHYHSLSNFFENLGIKVTRLVGGQNKRMRTQVKEEISSGEAKVIVGTHAMFQADLNYNKLALVIIDEQHRFGVAQRGDLITLAKNSFEDEQDIIPHILVMTATPIPRTLTMTVYGDLDVSVIRTKPKDRKAINTKIAFDHNREEVYDFVKQRVKNGEQAYIVYPLVEESEKIDLKSAVGHFEMLSNEIFTEFKCGLIHGQMFWYEKEEAMKSFLEKEYDILISTTVIEVGIDVPNATIMLIEHAERFGLSQLHQLRGRVGRGSMQSYCILMSPDHFKFAIKKSKNPEQEKNAAIARLKTMEMTGDGFKIAEFDLKLRGPGDVLGTKQSGLPDFQYIDIVQDTEIVSAAKKQAEILLINDPAIQQSDNQIIKIQLQKLNNGKNYFEIA